MGKADRGSRGMQALGWPARAAEGLLGLAAMGFVLFEEFFWSQAMRWAAKAWKFLPARRLEQAVRGLGPGAAACCFVVPALALLPVKIAGIKLMAGGHAAAGAAVFLCGKAAGTALAAKIYSLTEPALMQIGWLSRLIGRVLAWKGAIKAWAGAQPAVAKARRLAQRAKARLGRAKALAIAKLCSGGRMGFAERVRLARGKLGRAAPGGPFAGQMGFASAVSGGFGRFRSFRKLAQRELAALRAQAQSSAQASGLG